MTLKELHSASQVEGAEPNPLRTFLAVSMLATDTETQDSKNDKDVQVSSFLIFFAGYRD